MERCDFSSVITIIRNYISESREINQTDLLYDLFDAFTEEEQNKDYVFDNGLVCRWIKGIANISGSSLEPVGKKLQYSRRNLINL